VRSLGPFFRSDAVAWSPPATAETDPDLREQPRLSDDGSWWWDGRRWLATSTPDGLWQWDGERWRPTIELRGVRSRDLATTLALLAEDRHAGAAAILVERAREWRPPAELRELVARAQAMRRRALRIDGATNPPGLLRRMRAGPEERERIEEEEALLDTQYRGLLVQLGRRAPRPTVKEADDLLQVARLLDERAARITDAVTAADEAERARAHGIEDATRRYHEAETACRAARDAAARAVARAREADEGERQAMREQVRRALAPAAGEPLAEVGPLRVHEDLIETPAGRLPVHGACAAVGSAVSLWREHRDLLEDLVLLYGPDIESFQRCLSERRRDLFLLLDTRSRALLWHCPPGDEKPLRRLGAAVNGQAERGGAAEAERRRLADAVRAELASERRPGVAAVARARARLAHLSSDDWLQQAMRGARQRLEWAYGEPPELLAARRWATEEIRAVCTPPAPLTVAV
jgi:hypothetical protein